MYKLRKENYKKYVGHFFKLKNHAKKLNCANNYNNLYNFSYIKTENKITVHFSISLFIYQTLSLLHCFYIVYLFRDCFFLFLPSHSLLNIFFSLYYHTITKIYHVIKKSEKINKKLRFLISFGTIS